jgi:hypothetical protein
MTFVHFLPGLATVDSVVWRTMTLAASAVVSTGEGLSDTARLVIGGKAEAWCQRKRVGASLSLVTSYDYVSVKKPAFNKH